jgi:hypothetical protein
MEVSRALNKLNNKIKCLQNSYYDSFNVFPENGVENKLYIDKSNGKTYIWNGSTYVSNNAGIDLSSVDLSVFLNESGDPYLKVSDTSNIDLDNFLNESSDPFARLSDISEGSDIEVVLNYSALPDPTTVSGQFYWVSNSQGTKWTPDWDWLPLGLGDPYYTNGMYYSNGVFWEYTPLPYQATQTEVNTGTNEDKFVTPKTFNDADKWNTKEDKTALAELAYKTESELDKYTQSEVDALIEANLTTGTEVYFDKHNVYGSFSTPVTGNITHNLTGAKVELIQKMYHQGGTEPTYPASWVKLIGEYSTTDVNIIFALYAEAGRVEYWIR